MAESLTTRVLIRVQARGGKFLGPNVNYSMVSVLNGAETIFGPALASGDSGTVDDKGPFRLTASRDVIVVQPVPKGPPEGAYALLPILNLPPGDDLPPSGKYSAGIVATFELAEPALLEFRATALANTGNPVTASSMMWVYPGLQLTREPGLLLSIPGLAVSIAPPALGLDGLTVTATVTMMCGCPISAPAWPPSPPPAPEPYWPAPEFDVVAILTPPAGPPVTQRMGFTGTNTFEASFALPPAGRSTIAVYAVQPAEANVGYAQVSLTIPASVGS